MAVIAATSKNEINYASTVLFLLKLPPSSVQLLPDDTEGKMHRSRPRLRLINESKLPSAQVNSNLQHHFKLSLGYT